MTFQKSIPGPTAPSPIFEVGNFALQAHRTCAQARQHFGLSQREIELVMSVGAGYTKRQIAHNMGVTLTTVDTFRRRAYTKLGVKSGSAAVAIIAAFLAGTEVQARVLEDVC